MAGERPYYFLSYSRADYVRAQQLASYLRDRGVALWFDKELRFADTWSDVLVEKIRGADGLILIASQAARDSKWVTREIAVADEAGKRIYPLLIESLDRPFIELTRLQYVDLRSDEYPPNELILQLGGIPNQPSPATQAQPGSELVMKSIKGVRQCYVADPMIGIIAVTGTAIQVHDGTTLDVVASTAADGNISHSSLSADRKQLATSSWASGYQSPDTWRIFHWTFSEDGEVSIQGRECYRSWAWNTAGCVISPDSRMIAAAADKIVKIIDVEKCALMRELNFENPADGLLFPPDQEACVCSFSTGESGVQRLILWDAVTGKILRGLEFKEGLTDAVICPDGNYIATATGRLISLWDCSRWEIAHRFEGFYNKVQSFSFDPGGKRMVAATQDTISVWDVPSGRSVGAVQHEAGAVRSCSIADDIVVSAHWRGWQDEVQNKLLKWDLRSTR